MTRCPCTLQLVPVTRIENKRLERTGVRTQSSSKMEGVMDKDQRLGGGRGWEAGLDEEEIKLLLPRKGADEHDPLGADIRDVL